MINVLLIEDNPGDVRLIEEMISEVSGTTFDPECVDRLSSGLERLAVGGIDLILLDLGLPDSSGLETFIRVYEQSPQVPIIVLSGLDDKALAVDSVRRGAQDYIIKGQVDSNLLGRAMHYAIERKKAEEQIKKSLKEKEVMLREIHHRVKNNLQVVSSLLNIQAQAIKDKDTIDILFESRERINAMSLIHSQLYEGKDFSEIRINEFVDRLVNQLLSNYSVKETRITPIIQVAECLLPISVAVPVGLILNELISNVFKHAFDKREKGVIKINLHASENGRVSLTVSDDGVGLPPGFDIDMTDSLGLHLVKILTEDQLQGKVQVINNEGSTFIVEFEIEDNGGV